MSKSEANPSGGSPHLDRRRFRRAFSRWPLALVLASLGPASASTAAARGPNVVLIVADDLGYSDLGSYGGEIDTPQLDRLAYAGIRFSRFHATPRCSPTRAALLTGAWPHQAGVGYLNRDWGRDAYRGAIHDSLPTIAERLRSAGYATYMVGKWHLTPDLPDRARADDGPPSSWPLQRGFDAFYGTLGGSGSYFEPPYLYDGNEPAPWPPVRPGAGTSAGGAYLTDVLGERAASWVARHLATSPEQPFFLYLAFTAPHWPLHAPPADVERYRGRFDTGWDALRTERFRRQRELGLAPAGAALPPRESGVEAWSATPDREWQARRMEVYAAMVSAMDRAVGSVIAALEAASAKDDTLIVFLSDNGAGAEEFRGLYTLAPLFVPVPRSTTDGREVRFGDRPDTMPGPADTFATYGRGWAHLSSTPLRGYKHWTHEGGLAVPFFVHWPERLRDRAGTIVDTPAHVVDLAPTLLAIADAGADRAPQPLPGQSLLPLLDGDPGLPRTLYWEHEGNRAVESGGFKLVSHWPFGWELYDLGVDRSETTDLAASSPERVADLTRRFNQWAAAVGVEPWPLVVPAVRTTLLVVAGLLLAASAIRRVVRRRPGPASAPSGPRPEPPETTTPSPSPPTEVGRPATPPPPPPPIRPH